MKRVLRIVGLLSFTVAIVTTMAGCPQNQEMLEIYLVNVHPTFEMNGLELVNQRTGLVDDIAGVNVPPGFVELVRVPLADYVTDSGTITILFDLDFVNYTNQEIGETPLAFVLYESNNDFVVGKAVGGATLDKLSPGLLGFAPME